MLKVALTGGIATGKSYVARQLAAGGVPVVDADQLAREVVAPGTAGLAAVCNRFGAGLLHADGTLDRQRLGDIVFRDPAARRDLEAITHPAIRSGIDAFFERLPSGTAWAVADIPLLYETCREAEFDRVIVAACAPALQLSRLMARDGLTREEAERRIAAQLPIEQKVQRGDYVVRTDGTFAETRAQVERLRQTLLTLAGRQPGTAV